MEQLIEEFNLTKDDAHTHAHEFLALRGLTAEFRKHLDRRVNPVAETKACMIRVYEKAEGGPLLIEESVETHGVEQTWRDTIHQARKGDHYHVVQLHNREGEKVRERRV